MKSWGRYAHPREFWRWGVGEKSARLIIDCLAYKMHRYVPCQCIIGQIGQQIHNTGARLRQILGVVHRKKMPWLWPQKVCASHWLACEIRSNRSHACRRIIFLVPTPLTIVILARGSVTPRIGGHQGCHTMFRYNARWDSKIKIWSGFNCSVSYVNLTSIAIASIWLARIKK